MRLATIAVSICVAFVTQSCRIEMPSLVELISSYDTGRVETVEGLRQIAYDFSNSKALKLQTGFKDTLIIGDDPESFHGMHMRWIITRAQVPEENTVYLKDFSGIRWGNIGLEMLVSDEWRALREKTRVVHAPYLAPFAEEEDIGRMASTDIVFSTAAGNMEDSFLGDRDIYNKKHLIWNYGDTPERVQISQEWYRNLLRVHETGKAIAVTSGVPTGSGEEVLPNEWVVSCGDVKEACFTVLPRQNTSSASARFSAMSFYVAQFWETAEEVIEVLEVCAIDVGEKGVDREFGRGVTNLLCPRILQKELDIVEAHLGKNEKREETQGGELQGTWRAENAKIQVHIPKTIQTTLEVESTGTVEGTIDCTENTLSANFTVKASIRTTFLLAIPIEATAEETIQKKERYTTEGATLTTESLQYTYTATDDSLHLVQTFTLNEIFTHLPGYFKEVMTKEPMNTDDPITVTMSFAKEKRTPGDFNEDDRVDFADFLLFSQAFGANQTDQAFNKAMDLVPDGMINFSDFLVFIELFKESS